MLVKVRDNIRYQNKTMCYAPESSLEEISNK